MTLYKCWLSLNEIFFILPTLLRRHLFDDYYVYTSKLMQQRRNLRKKKLTLLGTWTVVAKAFLHQWWIFQPSPLTQVGSILSKTTSLIISTKCHIDSYNLHSLYFKWWRWKASAIQKSTFLLSRRGCRLWRLAKLAVPSTEFHETLHRYVDPNQTLQWVELSFNLRGQFLHFLP